MRFRHASCQVSRAAPRSLRNALSLLGTLAAVLLAGATPAAAAPRGLDVGFSDDLFTSANAADRTSQRSTLRGTPARASCGSTSSGVPSRPTRPAAPQDPADPAYRWGALDAGVRDAQARGLKVLLTITGAPAWAEGPGRPRSAAPGTWKPDPEALGDFAGAAARRYPGGPLLADLERAEPRRASRAAVDAPKRPSCRGRRRSSTGACSTRPTRRSRRSTRRTRSSRWRRTRPYGDPPGVPRTRPVTFWKAVLKRPHELRRLRPPPLFDRRARAATP